MGDVSVKCTYTYLREPSSDCQTQVEMEIYFEPHSDPKSWTILVAPISLCIGRHKVSWAVVGTPVKLADFELKSATPSKVKLVDWPPKPDPVTGKWTVIIENMGVTGVNGFSYDFGFTPPGHSGKPLRSSSFICDPTIAVTPDPIEIPPKYPL